MLICLDPVYLYTINRHLLIYFIFATLLNIKYAFLVRKELFQIFASEFPACSIILPTVLVIIVELLSTNI